MHSATDACWSTGRQAHATWSKLWRRCICADCREATWFSLWFRRTLFLWRLQRGQSWTAENTESKKNRDTCTTGKAITRAWAACNSWQDLPAQVDVMFSRSEQVVAVLEWSTAVCQTVSIFQFMVDGSVPNLHFILILHSETAPTQKTDANTEQNTHLSWFHGFEVLEEWGCQDSRNNTRKHNLSWSQWARLDVTCS